MELKPSTLRNVCPSLVLLIVPYGIETYACVLRSGMAIGLLIVPYGIETWEHTAADAAADASFNRTLWN